MLLILEIELSLIKVTSWILHNSLRLSGGKTNRPDLELENFFPAGKSFQKSEQGLLDSSWSWDISEASLAAILSIKKAL